ncbi:MAG: glucosaminidase domain-containing protein [Bacteroidia bacterium]
MITRFKAIFISLISATIGYSQPNNKDTPQTRLTVADYITEYADDAVLDMKKTGVPASITLAQGMYESDYGNSPLALDAKNHFGIKCHKEWTGDTFHQDDDEKNECFRKYKTVLDSYIDHSMFLKTRDRYKFLFDLDATDYKGWAKGLKKAGYATNPEYANRLIKIIEESNLNRFDKEGEKAVAELKLKEQSEPVKSETKTSSTKPTFNIPTKTLCDDIPFLIAAKGDTWFKLAKENNIELGDIYKYNDADANMIIRNGMLIYLNRKHNRSSEDSYTARKGDSMWYISQVYGVKLRKLYRHNKMHAGTEPQPGQKIKLR